MKHVKIQTPKPPTNLPAHEHAARRRRAGAEHLPGIPGHRAPRTPKPPTPPPGRKTFDTRILDSPSKF